MDGYKKTKLGMIPVDWEYQRIDKYLKIYGGFAFKSNNFITENIENSYQVIRMSNVQMSQLLLSKSPVYLPSEKVSDKELKYLLKKDDVLITLTGTMNKRDYGNVVFIEKNENYLLNQRVACISSKNNNFFNQYIYFVMQGSYFRNSFFKFGLGGTGNQANVSINDLNSINIPVPPLPEQKKIALILDSVDKHIDEVEGMVEDLKELKKGLMQKLLTEGIGHKEFKDSPVGRIPVEWEVKRLYACIDDILDYRGRTPKKLGLEWGNGNIPALSANNVKMGKVDFNLPTYYGSDELHKIWMKGTNLEKGDILMTMEAPLGNIAEVPTNGKYILSQRVVAFKSKEFILNEFFKYLLMSPYFQEELDRYSTGTTAKGINQKNLSKLSIPVPNELEQKKIAEILSKVDDRIETYETEKSDLQELKKGLMQQLLTGKTRVKL